MDIEKIRAMANDMEEVEKFLEGCTGRFVSDTIQVKTADFAALIRTRADTDLVKALEGEKKPFTCGCFGGSCNEDYPIAQWNAAIDRAIELVRGS